MCCCYILNSSFCIYVLVARFVPLLEEHIFIPEDDDVYVPYPRISETQYNTRLNSIFIHNDDIM